MFTGRPSSISSIALDSLLYPEDYLQQLMNLAVDFLALANPNLR